MLSENSSHYSPSLWEGSLQRTHTCFLAVRLIPSAFFWSRSTINLPLKPHRCVVTGCFPILVTIWTFHHPNLLDNTNLSNNLSSLQLSLTPPPFSPGVNSTLARLPPGERDFVGHDNKRTGSSARWSNQFYFPVGILSVVMDCNLSGAKTRPSEPYMYEPRRIS